MPLSYGPLARTDFARVGQEDFRPGEIDAVGHGAMTPVPDLLTLPWHSMAAAALPGREERRLTDIVAAGDAALWFSCCNPRPCFLLLMRGKDRLAPEPGQLQSACWPELALRQPVRQPTAMHPPKRPGPGRGKGLRQPQGCRRRQHHQVSRVSQGDMNERASLQPCRRAPRPGRTRHYRAGVAGGDAAPA